MNKITRTGYEIIIFLVLILAFVIILNVSNVKSYTRGYKDGLQQGKEDCKAEIIQSQKTIIDNEKEKQSILTESDTAAYNRFKRNTSKGAVRSNRK